MLAFLMVIRVMDLDYINRIHKRTAWINFKEGKQEQEQPLSKANLELDRTGVKVNLKQDHLGIKVNQDQGQPGSRSSLHQGQSGAGSCWGRGQSGSTWGQGQSGSKSSWDQGNYWNNLNQGGQVTAGQPFIPHLPDTHASIPGSSSSAGYTSSSPSLCPGGITDIGTKSTKRPIGCSRLVVFSINIVICTRKNKKYRKKKSVHFTYCPLSWKFQDCPYICTFLNLEVESVIQPFMMNFR